MSDDHNEAEWIDFGCFNSICKISLRRTRRNASFSKLSVPYLTNYSCTNYVLFRHLRRYLLCLQPTSRVEIHLTSRYSFVTGHTELAVFATRPLARGLVVQELQGSVVPLPDEWREEMDIGDDFAVEAAEESDSERDEEEEDVDSGAITSTSGRRGKSKTKEECRRQGQRRSDRTKRRDFSIVWSGLKRCYQLFLGPARFLNVRRHKCDCTSLKLTTCSTTAIQMSNY